MEAASSSSKVTVEYHDPSGLFPLIYRDLSLRLPLRNLNWQSSARPLRQIKSLHVDFTPDKDTETGLRPPSRNPDSEAPTSFDILRANAITQKQAVKERRHQIPGLKKSPYLRIYVLRCDGKDNYKDVERRKVREWIRDHAPSESHRDQHDACEWLILHVVMPDTVASSEPRWREGGSKDSDEIKERPKPGAKWPGKSTKTVFDRLRADFNESGKTSQDRVAQIRLLRNQVPADLLPTPAVAPTLEETAQERENAWADLILKLKTLLLGPFDLRVRQYEHDIVEQESRRSLPGWNFCTFFIHKEGLAKALESIGLAEDALAIYDELSLGLETVLRDIASGQAEGTATSFATHTDDILTRLLGEHIAHANGTTNDITIAKNAMTAPPKLFEKDYREQIVTSNISIFDFSGYIFSRQRALLLRLANARVARLASGSAESEAVEDLVLTSEVCWRASSFIPQSARALRKELATNKNKNPDQSDQEIESTVCSWIFAVAAEILEDTFVPALQDIVLQENKTSKQLPNGSSKRPSLSIGLGANPYPQRTTSLTGRRFTLAHAQGNFPRPKTLTSRLSQPISPSSTDLLKPVGLPGQPELATYRAELILMQRRMLERLAQHRGWYAGWAFLKSRKDGNFADGQIPDDGVRSPTLPTHALCPALKAALDSYSAFQATFEDLTDQAIRHYYAATQAKSIETMVGDIAILRFQQGDFSSSATYLQHALKSFASPKWDLREYEALGAYAAALEKLERYDDFVETVMMQLAKVCARKAEETGFRPLKIRSSPTRYDEIPNTSQLLLRASERSLALRQPVILPLEKYFARLIVHPTILHHDNSDGFDLRIELDHILDDEIKVDDIKLKLTNVQDPLQEIWLSNSEVGTLQFGHNELRVTSHTTTFGPFELDQVVININNLRFIREFKPKAKATPLGIFDLQDQPGVASSHRPLHVYVYPASGALKIEVQQFIEIAIGKRRSFSILLNSGWNEIQQLDIRIKPMSAGLRLHLADAQVVGESAVRTGTTPGVLIGTVKSRTQVVVLIPYSLEQSAKEISVRLEVDYETPHGLFTLFHAAKVLHELPLDVDVNDSFRTNALLSSFSLRTTGNLPFTVLGATLHESPVYNVSAPPQLPLPAPVLDAQPLGLIYKITRKSSEKSAVSKKDAALALSVQYRAADDAAIRAMQRAFLLDLGQSQFASLAALLQPLLVRRARVHLDASDFEMAALFNEVPVPDFVTVGWEDLIGFLPESIMGALLDWLRLWHLGHAVIPLTEEDNAAVMRSITISVDVPMIDVVFNANLTISSEPTAGHGSLPVLTLGNPVTATLRIKHTNQWSARTINAQRAQERVPSDRAHAWRFVFSAGTDADAWLIGGQRRCHFDAEQDSEHSWTLSLIPLRLGRQRLPRIEIQLASPGRGAPDAPVAGLSLSCATYYESVGQVVHVVRNYRTSRIHIAESSHNDARQLSERPGTASKSELG